MSGYRKPTVEIDLSANDHDYLKIEPVSGNSLDTFRVRVFSEFDLTVPRYDFIVEKAFDRTSIVIKLATTLACDQGFGFGRDALPYLWMGTHWRRCDKWFDSLAFALYALIRAGSGTRSADSLYSLTHAAWRARSIYDAQGLDLQAFGKCAGIPLLDGVLVPSIVCSDEDYVVDNDSGDILGKVPQRRWRCDPHRPSNLNLRLVNLTVDQAIEAMLIIENGRAGDSELFRFIYSSLKPEDVETIQLWFGYHVVTGITSNSQKMVYLWGAGANGKSQLLSLIRGFVGADACAEVRLSDLRIQANLEKLVGKLAMLGSEATPESDLEILKMLISREPVSCNPKYRDPFTIAPEVLITQASNSPPAFNTRDNAMERRVVSIHMPNSFESDEEGVVDDIAKVILRDEFDLLVGWSLLGAMECIAKDGFKPRPDVIEQSRETVRSGNPISDFIEILEIGDYEIAVEELVAVFQAWCIKNHPRERISNKECIKEVLRLLRDQQQPVIKISGSNYESSYWIYHGKRQPVVEQWKDGVPARVALMLGFRVGTGWLSTPVGHPIGRRKEWSKLRNAKALAGVEESFGIVE